MTVVTKSGDSSKWETLRKLRFGDVRKLIVHRYGPAGCPDDDAGRPDLMELLYLASLAPAGAEKKVANLIELYAPWMQQDEAEALIRHLSVTPNYQKLRTAEELGRILHLTNADRERLKLWRIRPFDMTAEHLATQAKEKERARRERARRKCGIRTKEAYLAKLASRPKPWAAEGISQRTWLRRQKKRRDCETKLSRHESQTIVTKQRTHPATTDREVDAKKGLQGSGATRRQVEQRESEQLESQLQRRSPALPTQTATRHSRSKKN